MFFKTPLRILQERELKKFAKNKKRIKILEIGAGKKCYRYLFTSCEYVATDLQKYPHIDEVADVTNLKYPNNSFDVIVCLNVLEHVREFDKAISEIHTVLKWGGEAVISVLFLYPLHDIPKDYWRFTEFALKKFFKRFFKIDIKPLSIFGLRFPFGYFVIVRK